MIAELKPYPAMKSSGVPWMEVPHHWRVQRLRHLAELRVSNVDKHTREGEQPVRLCNYTDVYKNDRIHDQMSFMTATASLEEIERFRLEAGDVLITKDSESWDDIGVPALVEVPADDLISGYHLGLLRPTASQVLGPYLFRAFQTRAVAQQLHVGANGVTRYGLAHDAIKSVWMAVPPLPEQAGIVRFLDHFDRRIGRYVRAKQGLIKLLGEQKQAIIRRAVTRGLDETVRLKSSDVDWIGAVPEHWEVQRSRYLFREIDNRSVDGTEQQLSMSQNLGLVPSDLVPNRTLVSESYVGGKLCEVGDLVLNRLKAHLGVFALANHAGVISPDYTVLRPIDPEGVAYFEDTLRSPACRRELRIRAKGIVEGFWRLYTDDFYDICLPVPPAPERRFIAEHIDTVTASIEKAKATAEREMALLQEYRACLIADVVTGKLDVREAAGRLPSDDDESAPLEDRIPLTPVDEEATDEVDAVPEEVTA